MSDYEATKDVLFCPFCGGKADPNGWLAGDGRKGPECEMCGATAESIEAWNKRAPPPTTTLTKADSTEPGPVVAESAATDPRDATQGEKENVNG